MDPGALKGVMMGQCGSVWVRVGQGGSGWVKGVKGLPKDIPSDAWVDSHFGSNKIFQRGWGVCRSDAP